MVTVTNGDVIRNAFPNAEIKFSSNLSGMECVEVLFGDKAYGNCYDHHIFSKQWWESEYWNNEDYWVHPELQQ